MAKELAYVLINPYTIRKSRTGGVIARYLSRTDLRLVGARMFGPSQELAHEYAESIRRREPADSPFGDLLANYVRKEYAPDPKTGRPHRTMCLLFEGEDAVAKIWNLTGSVSLRWGCGETVRETYGDYILDDAGNVTYFEPAVLVAPTRDFTYSSLRLWARYSETCGGIVNSAMDLDGGEGVEQTLVMLKPDNFQRPSLRMGNIMDLLSSAGLRIVAVNKFAMTVSQAEQFYAPVRESLRRKFPLFGAPGVAAAVSRELGFEVPEAAARALCEHISPLYAAHQFESIVEFMTGYKPSNCTPEEKPLRAGAECFAIIYEGADAVRKIRERLGETDPNKARAGSVRREFGTSIMVNAAHASDSAENAQREVAIIDIQGDNFSPHIRKYCYE
jgi:nucleoside diphosphate kinase